jgi:predicted DNA repair protein MutK
LATGLIALLDDVAAIAKLAAASVDDVAAQAAKASTKAAGVVIDDTAVTPAYVVGLSPSRELPIIGRIALGSLRNKLIFLLPLCLLLGYFTPWLITPLLMLGGIYLCFEGAEKVYEALVPHGHGAGHADPEERDPIALENQKVAGAIRTDFILSAEIMALTLAGVSESGIYTQAAVLAIVGVLITVGVYGVVAFIVKADDLGLWLAQSKGTLVRGIGKGLVKGVPVFLTVLAAVGTAAMLWVGGSIVIHGLAGFGFHEPEHLIESAAHAAETAVPTLAGVASWLTMSFLQAIVGIVVGAVAIVIVMVIRPLIASWRSPASSGKVQKHQQT